MTLVLLEPIARARVKRARAAAALEKADAEFLAAMRNARPECSWSQIADVANMSRTNVRYLVENLNERRGRNGNAEGVSDGTV